MTALLSAPDLPVEELAPTLWHLAQCMGAQAHLQRGTPPSAVADAGVLCMAATIGR